MNEQITAHATPVAIAAVLALSSTSGFAQDMKPVAPAPAIASNSGSANDAAFTPAPFMPTPASTPSTSTTVAPPRQDNSLAQALAGGGVLLLGLGGLALLKRRRDDALESVGDVVAMAPLAMPTTDGDLIRPSVAAGTASSPAPALMQEDALEAMIAASPSAANPFTTRKNRLRRAQFLLRESQPHQPLAPTPAMTSETPPTITPRTSREATYDFGRYDFGKGITGRPRLVPRTS